MRIESHDNLRIFNSETSFFDILTVKDNNRLSIGAELRAYSFCGYCAVVEFTGDCEKYRIFMFPNKSYLDEFLEDKDYKIIFSFGKEYE